MYNISLMIKIDRYIGNSINVREYLIIRIKLNY